MRALVIALVAVAPLSAQQPASDAVPRELALALISGFRGGRAEPDIVVGRAPATFPANVLPANANVLGGIDYSRATAVVLTAPESADSTRASLVRHLERLGWRVADRERGQGGFVASAQEMPRTFCRDDKGLSVVVRDRPRGGSLAMLSSWSGPCDEDDRRREGLAPPHLPTLEAPAGARSLGQGMGGGREGREAFTRLESSMPSAQIAAHYARQLTRAGWTVTGPAIAEGVVVYGVRHRDEENRPLGGALTVVEIPESRQREVLLRLAREERSR